MKYRKLTSTALAIASLACVATLNAASAGISAGPGGASEQTGTQQPVRLAQTATPQTQSVKKTRTKTKSLKVEHPKTNWLNPQPEPPMAGKKPVQGNNWLNPQPEPPRPDTTKKLQ
ncbi:hypothetical protein UNPF46_13815 [Bradyrhizobium sp. UNPF46]|uniref:hypothetical protein n=1 Tax=Bradyrhizobium sp. UNPF46 TaxID=1141168 RepID=UPI001150BFF5|nr:hypothetical protein [Bradyrhizobium sp. UNPF46]TQF39233.1 hypothetical protein UNPF46_13815 [Bradyrhizobium sp. UNPF46]